MRLATIAYSTTRCFLRRKITSGKGVSALAFDAIDPETQFFQQGVHGSAAVSLQHNLPAVKRTAAAELALQLLGQVANHHRIRSRQVGKTGNDHDDLASAILRLPAQNEAAP